MKDFKKPSKYNEELENTYSTSDKADRIPSVNYEHTPPSKSQEIELKRVQEVPLMTHLEVRFSQEGNTLGTTEEYEDLTISMEYQILPEPGSEGEGFFTLKTKTGWSIDSADEIAKLVESVRSAAIEIGRVKNA
jgi:hypothetical protein